MTPNDRTEIEWAPKVSLSKIRRLYLQEARGLSDESLVDDVGTRLLQRCESILEFSAATQGRVRCKRCARQGTVTHIERKTRASSELVKCPACGWQVRWRVYLKEAEKSGGHLHVGNAGAAFERYVQTYPRCKDARQKILAIDLLIHEFHWNLIRESQAGPVTQPHKPAGLNLLQGSTQQIIEFLNELTYGDHTPPELLSNREWWLSQKPILKNIGNKPRENVK